MSRFVCVCVFGLFEFSRFSNTLLAYVWHGNFIKCAQRAHSVKCIVYTIHYAHDINTSEGKLFLDVPRTWKQLRYIASTAIAATIRNTHTHTLSRTGVWQFLSFSVYSLVTTRSEMSIFWWLEFGWLWKKSNRNWNVRVPSKVKPFRAKHALVMAQFHSLSLSLCLCVYVCMFVCLCECESFEFISCK